jgi:GDP-L-fucose synthase
MGEERECLASFYEGKRVLVAGGTGFVGTPIVEELLKQGARVRVPIHKRPLNLHHERIETIRADLSKAEDCQAVVEGVDYVFHAAGAVGAAPVRGNRLMAGITTNLVLNALMLQAAWNAEVKRYLLFSSSTGYPVVDHPVKEEDMWTGPTYEGYFGYGWMRRYLEKLSEFVASQSKMKIALVRPTAVYGRYDNFDPAVGHVIPALIRKAVEKQDPFEVWGTGNEVRDFLNSKDLAHACLLLLEKYAECDPVNIGCGKPVTIREVMRIILKAAGHENAKVIFNSSRPTAIPIRTVDTSKAKRLLGFEPCMTLEEGLTDTVKWYAELPEEQIRRSNRSVC